MTVFKPDPSPKASQLSTRRAALRRLGGVVVGGLAAGLGASALLFSSWAPRDHRLPRLRVVPLRPSDLEVDHELAG